MHRGAAELSAVKSDLDRARVRIVGLETCVSESNRSLKESRRVLEEQRRQLQQEREKARADRSELDRQRALFEQYTKAATQLNDQHLHVQRQLLKSETTLQNTLDALTAAKRDLQVSSKLFIPAWLTECACSAYPQSRYVVKITLPIRVESGS